MSYMFDKKEHVYYNNEKARQLFILYNIIEKNGHENKMMFSDDLNDSISKMLDKILEEFDTNVIVETTTLDKIGKAFKQYDDPEFSKKL